MKDVFKNRIVRKLRHNDGFSIAELLIATLIMMLATALIAECSVIAREQFMRSTRESEAQLLISTIATNMQDTLTYASDPDTEADGKLKTFTDRGAGLGKGASFVMMTYSEGRYTAVNTGMGELVLTNEEGQQYPMANPGMYAVGEANGGNLAVKLELLSYNKDKGQYTISVAAYPAGNGSVELARADFVVNPAGSAEIAIATKGIKEPDAEQFTYTDPADPVLPEIIPYIVTYNGANGEVATEIVNAEKMGDTTVYGFAQGTPTSGTLTGERTGYTFDGWFLDETLITFPYQVTNDIALTGKWTAERHTITLDFADGSLNDGQKIITLSDLGDPAKPIDYETLCTDVDTYLKATYTSQKVTAPEGMTFEGFFYKENGEFKVFPDSSMHATVTENLTLYARYKLKSYRVELVDLRNTADENAKSDTYVVTNAMTHVPDYKPLDTAGMTGSWEFLGWYTGFTSANSYADITKVLGEDGQCVEGSSLVREGEGGEYFFNLSDDLPLSYDKEKDTWVLELYALWETDDEKYVETSVMENGGEYVIAGQRERGGTYYYYAISNENRLGNQGLNAVPLSVSEVAGSYRNASGTTVTAYDISPANVTLLWTASESENGFKLMNGYNYMRMTKPNRYYYLTASDENDNTVWTWEENKYLSMKPSDTAWSWYISIRYNNSYYFDVFTSSDSNYRIQLKLYKKETLTRWSWTAQ